MSLSLTKIGNNNYQYNRSSSIKYLKLQNVMSSRYNNNNCLITPSGMAAIDLAFNTIFIENKWTTINIIYSWELYYESPELFEYYKKIYSNIQINLFEISIISSENDNEFIIDLFKNQVNNQINILFVESCSNDRGWFIDIDIIKEIRSLSKKLYFIIDNTWLTSVIFNPFRYDVDIVVTSLSKHYSGGLCIGGAILIKNKNSYNILNELYKNKGYYVSDIICDIILQNIKKMNDRLIKTSQIANKISNYLKTHNKITQVSYPLLKKHSSYRLKEKFFFKKIDNELLGPDIFSFEINENKNILIKKLINMNILNYKTSYGGKDSRIDPSPIEIKI